ncbi:hypothetical protein H0X09_00490 [Candidatus Saccharibacteria bacterium]|nr:hypothetical protein [Candidatus Saccharibacteria bacterium]
MDNQEPEQKPEMEQHSTADYASYKSPGKNKRKRTTFSFNWRKPLKYLLILLSVAAIAAAVYWFTTKPKLPLDSNNKKAQSAQNTSSESSKIETTTSHYSSTELKLEFDYPADWKVTDTPGSGRLSVASPEIQLTDQDGKKVTGQITMAIRSKGQPLPEFDKGNAVAARSSEKISYTKPSQNQRATTYISFLRYASSPQAQGDFDGIYITGDTGYQKDQAIPKADFTPIDPGVSVTFTSEGAQLTVSDNIWDDPSFSKPIKDMLQSLVIN